MHHKFFFLFVTAVSVPHDAAEQSLHVQVGDGVYHQRGVGRGHVQAKLPFARLRRHHSCQLAERHRGLAGNASILFVSGVLAACTCYAPQLFCVCTSVVCVKSFSTSWFRKESSGIAEESSVQCVFLFTCMYVSSLA